MVNCKAMAKSFDIGLERLTGAGVPRIGVTQEGGGPFANDAQGKKPSLQDASTAGATFYLETFGCQMNDHDSEKVAGVLLARGYRQVDGPEAAKVILYNTCSIREKAAQKVFSRLGELRPAEEKLTAVSRQPLAEERSGEWRVLGGEQAGAKNAQAGVPVPQKNAQAGMPVLREANHPSQRKIVNAGGGKIIGALGCVAQQEGEGIFERAPWVR